MCKVIIDSFDTQEQAVAFVDWFRKRCDASKVELLTTEGLHVVEYDGVDTRQTSDDQIIVNVVTSTFYEE